MLVRRIISTYDIIKNQCIIYDKYNVLVNFISDNYYTNLCFANALWEHDILIKVNFIFKTLKTKRDTFLGKERNSNTNKVIRKNDKA